MKVALIGCGAIGTVLAKSIDSGKAGDTTLKIVYDLKPEKCAKLANKMRSKPKVAKRASEIYADKTVSLVVEAAAQTAVRQYALNILRSGKDLMVMSVGAFSDEKLLKSVTAAAKKTARKVHIPSGAIIGIDGIKAAGIGRIKEVTLTTRKPPAALAYSDYVKKRGINLKNISKPIVLFQGPARTAVRLFPASVNVAATLSLAGIGLDRTKVRVIADPKTKRNVHEIRVKGDAGELLTEARNVPMPDTPRTSQLAALSAIRTLRNLSESLRVGT
ncbi:MAG: aspartate dehydrogenase [Candidatus Hadarchaeota archaeon]